MSVENLTLYLVCGYWHDGTGWQESALEVIVAPHPEKAKMKYIQRLQFKGHLPDLDGFEVRCIPFG